MVMSVVITDDGSLFKSGYLSNLGDSQHAHFNHLGSLSNLESAILNKEMAQITVTQAKWIILQVLIAGSFACFQQFSDPSDLEKVISNTRKAFELIGDNHPSKPGWLTNLGIMQESCFQHFRNLVDLEDIIMNNWKVVYLTDDTHLYKPFYLYNPDSNQDTQFQHFSYLSDLENATSKIKSVVELTNDSHPDRVMYLLHFGISQ